MCGCACLCDVYVCVCVCVCVGGGVENFVHPQLLQHWSPKFTSFRDLYTRSCFQLTPVLLIFLQEIEHLLELEEITLSSDLSQGYALKMLTGKKMAAFLAVLLPPFISLLEGQL